jgi:WD40 repeat protein
MRISYPLMLVIVLGLLAAYVKADGGAPASQLPASSLPNADANSDSAGTVRRFNVSFPVHAAAGTADGKLVAVAIGSPTLTIKGNGEGTVPAGPWQPAVEVLDAVTGKSLVKIKLTSEEEIAVLAATPRVSFFQVTALAFTPDGTKLAVGNSIGQIKLFGSRTGELIRTVDDKSPRLAIGETPENWKTIERAMGSVKSLAFSPDGQMLAACGESFADFVPQFTGVDRMGILGVGPGRLKIFDAKTGALNHDFVGFSVANSLVFSPEGDRLACVGRWFSLNEHGEGAIVWNSETGEKLKSISMKANGGANSVAFSIDGKLLAILAIDFDKDSDKGSNSVLCVAHAATGIVDWQRNFSGPVRGVAFYDGAVMTLCDVHSLRWFSIEDGKTLMVINRSKDDAERWNEFEITRQGHMLVMGGANKDDTGSVDVWDPEANQKAVPEGGAKRE